MPASFPLEKMGGNSTLLLNRMAGAAGHLSLLLMGAMMGTGVGKGISLTK